MAKWHGGKGSDTRPRVVSKSQFDDNWDRIFKKDDGKSKRSSNSDSKKQKDSK